MSRKPAPNPRLAELGFCLECPSHDPRPAAFTATDGTPVCTVHAAKRTQQALAIEGDAELAQDAEYQAWKAEQERGLSAGYRSRSSIPEADPGNAAAYDPAHYYKHVLDEEVQEYQGYGFAPVRDSGLRGCKIMKISRAKQKQRERWELEQAAAVDPRRQLDRVKEAAAEMGATVVDGREANLVASKQAGISPAWAQT